MRLSHHIDDLRLELKDASPRLQTTLAILISKAEVLEDNRDAMRMALIGFVALGHECVDAYEERFDESDLRELIVKGEKLLKQTKPPHGFMHRAKILAIAVGKSRAKKGRDFIRKACEFGVMLDDLDAAFNDWNRE